MLLSPRLVITLGMLALVSGFGVAEAIQVNIDINGTTVSQANCTTSGNPPLTTCTIAGTYGNVVVEPYPANGTARVEALDHPNLPYIRLKEAKFRAINTNSVDGSVSFSATFSGRTDPKMVRSASGYLVRTESTKAAYSSPSNRGEFLVEGQVISDSLPHNPETVDGLQDYGDQGGSQKVVNGLAWGFGKIDSTLFTTTPEDTTLSGSRDLSVDFTFHLPIINDYLRLSEVKVETLDPGRLLDPPDWSGYTDNVEDQDEDTGGACGCKSCCKPCKPCKKCKKCKK